MNVKSLPVSIRRQIPNAQLPVQYKEACKALIACTTIDEAKFYSNKADALAAWAKMFKSDEAAVAAKRLKLHAYRRMGELAEELRPFKAGRRSTGGGRSLLREQGLTNEQASTARNLALAPIYKFRAAVDSPSPPSPNRFRQNSRACSDSYKTLTLSGASALAFRCWCRRTAAKKLARGLNLDEAAKARVMVREISDWLDEFEQHLPKIPAPSAEMYRSRMEAPV